MTLGISAAQPLAVRSYFPPRGEWRKQEPAAVGVDKTKLDEAITFAIAHENSETKDLAAAIPNQFRNEAPYNTLIGPTEPRTGANGLIIQWEQRELHEAGTFTSTTIRASTSSHLRRCTS